MAVNNDQNDLSKLKLYSTLQKYIHLKLTVNISKILNTLAIGSKIRKEFYFGNNR